MLRGSEVRTTFQEWITTTETTETTETGSSELNLLFDDGVAITPVGTDTAKHHSGQAVLKKITRPAAGTTLMAWALATISGVLVVAPYMALMRLGTLLLTAFQAHTPVDSRQVWFILGLLIDAYLARVGVHVPILAMIHLVDVRLSRHIQTQLLGRTVHAPLSWFMVTNPGKVRKVV